MRAYIIRRLLLMIPTLFVVSLIVFFMIRLIPGTIVDAMVALRMEGGAGVEGLPDREAIEHSLGLDVPIFTQYGRWIGVIPGTDGSFSGLLQGDLGNSLWKGTPVTEEIATRWPVTLELGFLALIIAQLIALPIGIFSALRQDTWGDYIARSFAIFCIAVPGFWLATMIIVFPSIWWGYSPPIIPISFTEDPIGNLKMFIIPAIVLGMVMSGGNHEDDPHHDAGGAEAGLYQDSLGKRAQGESGRHKACPEECANPGCHHNWSAGAGSDRGHGYYRGDILPVRDGPPIYKRHHGERLHHA